MDGVWGVSGEARNGECGMRNGEGGNWEGNYEMRETREKGNGKRKREVWDEGFDAEVGAVVGG